jgi:hypothetical protein
MLMRIFQCLFVCLAIVIADPSRSFGSEPPVAKECQSEQLKVCLKQLGGFAGRDLSRDAGSLTWCVKHLPPCAAQAAQLPPAAPSSATQTRADQQPSQQSIFLRADPLDNPYPGLTQSAPAGQALGASFGYTHNGFVQSNVKSGSTTTTVVSQSNSITFTGMATFLLADRSAAVPSGDVEWIPAFWIYGNGNWDNPTKAFGDTSAFKIGPKAEFLFHPVNGSQWSTYVDVAPFLQTDFYGIAHAGGGSISLMPYNRELFLGGMPDGPIPRYLAGFVELRAEAENLKVTIPGQTNLLAHDYQWLGGAARVYLFPFPSQNASPTDPLANRVSFIGTVQSYWDANSGITATLATAAMQYKLSCDTKASTVCPYGAPSLTLQYNYGVDKDFLQKQNLVKLMINYAY